MKLEQHALLDALCGSYFLGTLRGGARRRFEHALATQPLVALRLRHWQGIFAPRYTSMMEIQPSPRSWKRLERELELARYRAPWMRRAGFWRGWAVAATLALALVVGLQTLRPVPDTPPAVEIAQLAGKEITSDAHSSYARRVRQLLSRRRVTSCGCCRLKAARFLSRCSTVWMRASRCRRVRWNGCAPAPSWR
jgi:anti-sigma-K factor RskA